MEQGNKLKMRLFVRTLTGPALMWYAKQDVESLGSPKEKESRRKAAESTLGHDKINYILAEARSKDKGKVIVTETLNAPLIMLKTRKSQTFTPLCEPISIIFEQLRSSRILQPKPRKVPSHSFNSSKQCVFHSGMLGHTTNKCHYLKEEIQKLLNNGRIIQSNGLPSAYLVSAYSHHANAKS
ncbi:hypothetical protein HAX54_017117 [Datura stramonium]|uniref:Uncharacterized protein n=1 Tax=Datura stramonium TaxID=4076 RepID=A0ABS8UN08_DATST|nr:hypothetical protein [Datura stramonium]